MFSENEEFEVERLVDRKNIGGKVKYYVKWKNYGSWVALELSDWNYGDELNYMRYLTPLL